ncbi:hypothetical protein KIPB_008306 [Kipferlia bialata]|uniref:Uncharacterized protein n=1 Tax=Kipferlia bialata TaxID=797122 RepID=A0A9K3D1P0_9EUKA|nr:hypothetical protein KIPB_008306 [Kipferlia bialata]|eukprot:g8306.t1
MSEPLVQAFTEYPDDIRALISGSPEPDAGNDPLSPMRSPDQALSPSMLTAETRMFEDLQQEKQLIIDSQQVQITTLQSENVALNEQVISLNAEKLQLFADSRADKERLQRTVDDLSQQLTEAERESWGVREDHSAVQAGWQSERATMTDRLTAYEREVDTLKSENASLQERMSALDVDLSASRIEKDEACSTHQTMGQETDRLKREIQGLRSEVEHVIAARDEAQKAFERSQTELAQAQAQSNSRASALREQIRTLSKQVYL